MSEENKIFDSWEKYVNIVSTLGEEEVNNLIENIGERLSVATYSLTNKEAYCNNGGLVQFIIQYAKKAKQVKDAFFSHLDTKSVIKCALLSEIGRIGTQEHDRLIVQTSDWHREKLGQYFTWNDKCPKYYVPHMTLFWLNKYSVKLSEDELLSIILSQGRNDETKFYEGHTTDISKCLSYAREIVTTEFVNSLRKTSSDDVLPF